MNQDIQIDKHGRANIELHTPSGGELRIQAKILGHFGRHEARNMKLREDAWSVTHIPTGRCFGWYFKSPRQADAFMEDAAEFFDAEGVDMNVEEWEEAYKRVQGHYTLLLNMAAKHGALPSQAPRERLPGE